MLLEQHEFPNYQVKLGLAPWKKIKIIGYFGFVHCMSVGVGLGWLTPVFFFTNFHIIQASIWTTLIIPLIIGGFISLVIIYSMAKKAEKIMIRTEKDCKKLELLKSEPKAARD